MTTKTDTQAPPATTPAPLPSLRDFRRHIAVSLAKFEPDYQEEERRADSQIAYQKADL